MSVISFGPSSLPQLSRASKHPRPALRTAGKAPITHATKGSDAAHLWPTCIRGIVDHPHLTGWFCNFGFCLASRHEPPPKVSQLSQIWGDFPGFASHPTICPHSCPACCGKPCPHQRQCKSICGQACDVFPISPVVKAFPRIRLHTHRHDGRRGRWGG